jgi:hypothetical protein
MKKLMIGLAVLAALVVLALAFVWFVGSGFLGEDQHAGEVTEAAIPPAVFEGRAAAQQGAAAAAGSYGAKQILFGDFHVHSTFSADAFMASLPITGGEGARPVSDACDFARYCSSLDFWSINDHALSLTPRRWQETVGAMRQCDAVAGDATTPDVVPFLGWEWTQVGTTPKDHWGHKNVVLHYLDDERIPARPIGAGFPGGMDVDDTVGPLALGAFWLMRRGEGGTEFVRYISETLGAERCPGDVPVRDLPSDCMELAPDPATLFAKLDDWGVDSLVIPHGTTWGYYTPPGSSWDKQLTTEQHDPDRQTLVEVYSGHGNSEEYRDWRAVELEDGEAVGCPEPTDDYMPSCWQAGLIIQRRCLEAGEDSDECEERAAEARQNYVAAGVGGFHTVPGAKAEEWGDSGQCRDCFLPAFNYRPASSVQYMLALSNLTDPESPLRFRFGFLASSDNHSARPGTGYKEFDRKQMTEARFERFADIVPGTRDTRDPAPESSPWEPPLGRTNFFGALETERQASFFLTGGLVAVHAQGRSRDAIWKGLQRKEVYGTSGPRILLWFDMLNPPGTTGRVAPMGAEVSMTRNPVFQVRAVGSFEQEPGCPEFSTESLGEERLQSLCGGECYHPSDRRRRISRIEVVRIRPRVSEGEPVANLIQDPWQVFSCDADATGCRVTFSDPEFSEGARDAVYYVRAIEEPSLAIDADSVGCVGKPAEDDCLGEVEERAWSSPIFVDFDPTSGPLEVATPRSD